MNWNSHKSALGKHNKSRQRIIQLLHGKLPTASELSKRLPTQVITCPACHQADETNFHLLCCPNEDYKRWRLSFSRGLVKLCQSVHTDPVLVDILILGINTSFDTVEFVKPELTSKYDLLISSQDSIGWRNIFIGYFSSHLQTLQQEYLQTNHIDDVYYSSTHWTAKIISYFWEHWLNLWKLRNSYYHGRDKADKDLRLRAQTSAELEFLYQIKPHVEICNHDLYMESLSIHLMEPIGRQVLWLKMYKQLLLDSRAKLKQRTKEDIRRFFPTV